MVQLYVQSPYKPGGLEKAAVQLVAFEKTGVLEPGASEDVTVEFDPLYFASYDENAVKADGTTGAWVLEDGDYYFAIGNGAHEALNNILAKKTGSEDGLVKTADTEAIVPDNAIVWNLAETDIETYSAGVQNQLQDMDINKLIADTVEYTTRSDWTKG
ncbi:MAG: fibronectin type III-like domain-contianing protein [Atopobiaceae bacterium]|nr:fibronectin type III-like domain-contianing protein [Atopobiaceae bacterium]